MKPVTIDMSEVLAELERLAKEKPGNEPNTFTTTEIAESMQIGQHPASRLCKELVKAGRITAAMVWRVTAWGVRRPVMGYRIVGKGRK